MGLGKCNGTRHLPITPFEGSYAHKQELDRIERYRGEKTCPQCQHRKGFHCPTCWPK